MTTNDRKFRAFDQDMRLWTTALPASGFATPTTYIGKSPAGSLW